MKKIAALVLMSFALPAFSHSGHADSAGMLAGLAHPFTGIDHMLAMLGVGLWTRQLGRGLQLPLAFLATMLAGAVLQTGLPIEMGLAATVVLVGALIAAAVRLPPGATLALVSVFAFLHGQAHGRELAGAGAAAGFLVASAMLLAAGYAAGSRRVARVAGAAIGAAGLYLLAGLA